MLVEKVGWERWIFSADYFVYTVGPSKSWIWSRRIMLRYVFSILAKPRLVDTDLLRCLISTSNTIRRQSVHSTPLYNTLPGDDILYKEEHLQMKDSLRKVRWSKSIRLMIKDLKLTVFTFVAILRCTFCVRETNAFSRFVRIVSNETKIRRLSFIAYWSSHDKHLLCTIVGRVRL